MQGHGLAPIRTDQNRELICVDPCSSAALIIFSHLRWTGLGQVAPSGLNWNSRIPRGKDWRSGRKTGGSRVTTILLGTRQRQRRAPYCRRTVMKQVKCSKRLSSARWAISCSLENSSNKDSVIRSITVLPPLKNRRGYVEGYPPRPRSSIFPNDGASELLL
jgi:hypothetical protein